MKTGRKEEVEEGRVGSREKKSQEQDGQEGQEGEHTKCRLGGLLCLLFYFLPKNTNSALIHSVHLSASVMNSSLKRLRFCQIVSENMEIVHNPFCFLGTAEISCSNISHSIISFSQLKSRKL